MNKIRLGNVNYQIIGEDKHHPKLRFARGKCHYKELKLFVDKNLPKDLIIQTMYHEIGHAMIQESSFNDEITTQLGDSGYEAFIDNLGKLLYDMIHNNDMIQIENILLNSNKNKKGKNDDETTSKNDVG